MPILTTVILFTFIYEPVEMVENSILGYEKFIKGDSIMWDNFKSFTMKGNIINLIYR